jgi:ribonuclease HI
MLKMSKNHSTRLKVSNFPLENWNEVLNEQKTEFSEWNQSDTHATQLIKVMHSISRFIIDEYLIEESVSIKNSLKKTHLNLEIHQNSNAKKKHLRQVENITQTSNSGIFYTDAAFDSSTKTSTASCVLYHHSRTAYKTWNLEIGISIDDAELYAIEKATRWSKTWQNVDHIWFFTDSQNAIWSIEDLSHCLADEILETTKMLKNIQTRIHWISEHANIPENEKADQLAKSIFSSSTIAGDRFLSFKYLKNQITEHNHQRWLHYWKNHSKTEKHYEKFETRSEDSKIQLLSKKFTKHVISTIMQLKLEHEYFKSYLVRLLNYETKKCNEDCNFSQISEHLLLNCHHFTTERSIIINQIKSQTITLKTLFETKKNIENLKKFLIDIEIVTRKWILEDSKENEEDEWKNHLEIMRHSDDQASFWTLKRFDQSN